MSRFYQKYLNNLPAKGEATEQKIDPTSMSLSTSATGGAKQATGKGAFSL